MAKYYGGASTAKGPTTYMYDTSTGKNTNVGPATYRPQSQQSTLGASTQQSSGGGGGISRFDELAAIGGNRNPAQETEYQKLMQDQMMSQISEMYGPAIEATNQAERYANEGYNADVSNINSQVESQSARFREDEKDLLNRTQTEEDKFNNVLRSAYSEAVRAYNALNQQGNARFGRGSSAGQAVGELASQEFFRQQGKINERQAEGAQSFATERLNIAKFVKNKLADLDLYKNQAMTELKKNLNDQLLAIQMRRGEIEANKTRDRLAVLQNAIAQTQAIQQADKQFRRDIALSAVSKMQEVAGRAFTPQEIVATMQEFEGALTGVNVGAAPTSQSQTGINRRPGSVYDEFAGLV